MERLEGEDVFEIVSYSGKLMRGEIATLNLVRGSRGLVGCANKA